MVAFSGAETGKIRDFINGKAVTDRLRYKREGMEYLLMTHYSMGLKEVRELSVDDAKQLLSWAQAMQDQKEPSGNTVYLGYDFVPPLEAD